MADRAFLGGIGGIDVDYRHTCNRGFVVDELPKLIEAPVMLFASLRLSNRASFLDTLEIFQDYQGRSVYSLRNQHFRYAVVCIPMEPRLFARKLFQMTLRGCRNIKCTFSEAISETKSASGNHSWISHNEI